MMMYPVPSAQHHLEDLGFGCSELQQHARCEQAEVKAASTNGSSGCHQKGSQPENSVSTRLGSSASDFEPSGDVHLPSDLQLFSNLLDGHLATAWNALVDRDGDVAHLIRAALAHKASLLEQASRAVKMIQSGGRQVRCFVPGLRTAAQTRKRNVALSVMKLVQASVSDIKTNLADMRASYVALLEQVHYLIDCTDLELDYVNDCTTSGSASATVQQDIPEETRNFEMALESLHQAAAVMGGCFDSWLYLHSIELNARELEKGTKRLQQLLLNPRGQEASPAGLEEFCADLENLDEQCQHVM